VCQENSNETSSWAGGSETINRVFVWQMIRRQDVSEQVSETAVT